MTEIIRIGMDTSKQFFQLHGVDAAERAVLKKKLRRREMLAFFAQLAPTHIGIEACGASHYWARTLEAMGHHVTIMPSQFVKPYVKRGKNDAADAEALCEAMSRPSMRFVPVKSVEQQGALMLMVLRNRLVRTRTQLTNAIRGHAAEFGLIAARGLDKIEPLLARVRNDESLPELVRGLFVELGAELAELGARIRRVEVAMLRRHRGDEVSKRLAEIPGIGPVGASLLTLKAPDAAAFRCGRNFAAWMGLTPKDHSSGGKQKLGGITRAGDEQLRSVLVQGAMTLLRHVRNGRGPRWPWLTRLLMRKPPKLAAVAVANKLARMAWKLMVSGERYDAQRLAAAA